MDKVTTTKYRDLNIRFTGNGLYRWNKYDLIWERVDSYTEQAYEKMDQYDGRFGIVKVFTTEDVK